MAWAGFFFGAPCSEVSGLHILSWVAGFENSAVAWYVAVSQKLAGGTAGLIDALAEDAAADIKLGTHVEQIENNDHGVTVTARGGERFTARAAVVATPINTWHALTTSPRIGTAKAAMAQERMTGHATKIWALVQGVGGNFYGVGWETKIKWLATEYSTPEGDLLVGFGTSPEVLDVNDEAAVAAAVREFLPDADVVRTDAHDWNADEFSQGTWMAYRPGQVMRTRVRAAAAGRPARVRGFRSRVGLVRMDRRRDRKWTSRARAQYGDALDESSGMSFYPPVECFFGWIRHLHPDGSRSTGQLPTTSGEGVPRCPLQVTERCGSATACCPTIPWRLHRNDQGRRRARLLRLLRGRRDLAQGPVVPVRRGRRQDAQHPLRAQRDPRVPARTDVDLPAAGNPRRALRRAGRGGRLDRELRDDAAVPPRLGEA